MSIAYMFIHDLVIYYLNYMLFHTCYILLDIQYAIFLSVTIM